MKYSKSDSEYFRNKKGGGLETNGKLNKENFRRNEKNKLKEINISKNANTLELPEMNSSGKYKINPIKIMVKKNSFGANEHYIFFGLNRVTGMYEYVIYLNPDFSSSGYPIICKKINYDGTIVELTHKEFLDINIRELSILIYNLLLKHQQNKELLHENFFIYLLQFVLPKIIEKSNSVNNNNLKYIIGKIKEIRPNQNKNKNKNNREPVLPPRK